MSTAVPSAAARRMAASTTDRVGRAHRSDAGRCAPSPGSRAATKAPEPVVRVSVAVARPGPGLPCRVAGATQGVELGEGRGSLHGAFDAHGPGTAGVGIGQALRQRGPCRRHVTKVASKQSPAPVGSTSVHRVAGARWAARPRVVVGGPRGACSCTTMAVTPRPTGSARAASGAAAPRSAASVRRRWAGTCRSGPAWRTRADRTSGCGQHLLADVGVEAHRAPRALHQPIACVGHLDDRGAEQRRPRDVQVAALPSKAAAASVGRTWPQACSLCCRRSRGPRRRGNGQRRCPWVRPGRPRRRSRPRRRRPAAPG